MSRQSFILHNDTLGVLDKLTDEQAGRLFKAISEYQITGKEPEDPIIAIIFFPFKAQFDRDDLKYEKTCERNRNNGKKGGRKKEVENEPIEPKPNETQINPLGSLETQHNPKEPDSDSDSDSDSDNDILNKTISPEKKFSEESYRFTEWYFQELAPNTVKKSFNEVLRKKWQEVYDTLARKGYNKDQIVRACKWARQDEFWEKNFRSPAKLNKKNPEGELYIDVFLEKSQEQKKPVSHKSPNAKDEYKRILAIGWDKCSDEELEWVRAYQHADDARVYKTLPTDERLPNKVGVRKTIAQLQYERDLG